MRRSASVGDADPSMIERGSLFSAINGLSAHRQAYTLHGLTLI